MLLQMAIIAELPRVMAASAFCYLSLRVEAVSELIIQIVSPSGNIIAPVALDTIRLLTMTLSAPLFVYGRSLSVIVSPPGGMNIRQRNILCMTDFTLVRCFLTIVTTQTGFHARHVRPREFSGLNDPRVAPLTV